jgi:L-histidine Nalpha-methyltransferase
MAMQAPITLALHNIGVDSRRVMADEVRAGLQRTPKRLPSRYFYDARGSELFDAITELPEYYVTRAETEILQEHGREIVQRARPESIVELGAGSCTKTPILLETGLELQTLHSFVPFDISEAAVREAAETIVLRYPSLSLYGLVGDFETHLVAIPRLGRQLVLFLGSTMGNFGEDERQRFLSGVRQLLQDGPEPDLFLLGVDLVKDEASLHAAYNDSAGVTAAFNRNVLHVLNRELGANFNPDAFDHVAFYDPTAQRVEMHLQSRERQTVDIPGADLTVTLAPHECIHTETSNKFTRETTATCLEQAGMQLVDWYTDAQTRFGLALAAPR